MEDPASRVPPQLLQHLHLVAQFHYPIVQTTGLDFTLEKLLEAPRIVHDISPFSWTFLDSPPDGSLFLVYQSPNAQGRFASDGYVWGDAESYFRQEYHGYLIEMLVHNFGYNPNRESVQGPAAHSRRRYRLVLNPNNPNYDCNSNLWIVHYQRAQQMFPASRVPIGNAEHQSLQQRQWLQRQGSLMDNKFMLEDRANWPAILMPNTQHRGPGPAISFSNPMAQPAMRAQIAQPGYSTDHPPKRVRHNTTAQRQAAMQRPLHHMDQRSQLEVEEEEFKDLQDLMTQRDISQMRYIQHHEWMEELYSSYPTFSIKPVSLGLGRKGELEPLTNGFFDPPRPPTPPSADNEPPKTDDEHYNSTIHKPLQPGQAEEFYTRATEKVSQINKEMEEMKALHAKRMESFARMKSLAKAEKELRSVVAAGDEGVSSSEASKVDTTTQIHNPANGDATIAVLRQMEQIDHIGKDVESLTGMKINKLETTKLLQKGGLRENSPPTSESKIRGGSGAAGDNMSSIFDDFLEPGAGERLLSSGPQSGKPSASPAPMGSGSDHTMTGQTDGAADDWVMVNKNDSGPQATAAAGTTEPVSAAAGITASTAPVTEITPGSAGGPDASMNDADLGDDLVDFGGDDAPDPGFETNAFDDAIDFGDLDTAGAAMDDFGAADQGVDLNADLNLDNDQPQDTADNVQAQPQGQAPEVLVSEAGDDGIGAADVEDDAGAMDLMEDSAFGDAFHHTEAEAAAREEAEG